MQRRTLLLSLLLTACASQPPAPVTLAGEWRPHAAQLSGQDFPIASFRGATLVLGADSYEFSGDRGRYQLLAGGSPARVDIRGELGPNKGRQIQAIFELAGDELTMAYQLGSGERPTEFISPLGSQILVVKYRRLR
ncbi:TIGR03067 domain-containing protein [Pelomonas sp. SE-A7]|uniref:TIGR03067 domain-containing protein n=1 Tax=Pelomonas sp. SE-A7 TaxID=3054953 RepID=UPI00259C81D9|nr:TIGR03067 domain-containing protein [Pelomonas sp. SE-A7]MDM4765579.1 TIGR03067 domain-containing protein [Pelomonas sp. SE-A7]